MGAQSRLLPPSVPYRFFAAAAVFHVAAWALMAAAANDVVGFDGGPGLVLSAVHALTLGVLAMTVMGASFQLLPVATGRTLMAVWPCRAAWWLYFPGVAVLVYGFVAGEHHFMAGGGALSILALIIFAVLVADVLRRTRGEMKLLVMHGWGALASLLGLMTLGFALIVNQEHGFLPVSMDLRLAHMILAVFGFMGMLATGYSHILVPMFALSSAPDEGQGAKIFVLFLAVLVLAVGAACFGQANLLSVAATVAVAVAGSHIWTMVQALKQGMRKNLGLSFVLVKTAWGLLLLGLVVGAMVSIGLLGDWGAVLFGFLVLFGWLLTFLLGILQRIIPFLAAMNASKEDRTPPRLSELSRETPLKIHAACHFTALALVSLGIVTGEEDIILVGGLAGLAGSLAFLWFTVDVLRRMRGFHPGGETMEVSQQLNQLNNGNN